MNTPIEGSQTALETLVLEPVAGILGVTVTTSPTGGQPIQPVAVR